MSCCRLHCPRRAWTRSQLQDRRGQPKLVTLEESLWCSYSALKETLLYVVCTLGASFVEISWCSGVLVYVFCPQEIIHCRSPCRRDQPMMSGFKENLLQKPVSGVCTQWVPAVETSLSSLHYWPAMSVLKEFLLLISAYGVCTQGVMLRKLASANGVCTPLVPVVETRLWCLYSRSSCCGDQIMVSVLKKFQLFRPGYGVCTQVVPAVETRLWSLYSRSS
jgi:hypothetical protein